MKTIDMKGQSCYLVLKDYAYAEWFPSKRKAMNTLSHLQEYFNIDTLESDDWYLSTRYPYNFWRVRVDIYKIKAERIKNWKKHWKTTKAYRDWLANKSVEHLM